jgi:hypothetical protein
VLPDLVAKGRQLIGILLLAGVDHIAVVARHAPEEKRQHDIIH